KPDGFSEPPDQTPAPRLSSALGSRGGTALDRPVARATQRPSQRTSELNMGNSLVKRVGFRTRQTLRPAGPKPNARLRLFPRAECRAPGGPAPARFSACLRRTWPENGRGGACARTIAGRGRGLQDQRHLT